MAITLNAERVAGVIAECDRPRGGSAARDTAIGFRDRRRCRGTRGQWAVPVLRDLVVGDRRHVSELIAGSGEGLAARAVRAPEIR